MKPFGWNIPGRVAAVRDSGMSYRVYGEDGTKYIRNIKSLKSRPEVAVNEVLPTVRTGANSAPRAETEQLGDIPPSPAPSVRRSLRQGTDVYQQKLAEKKKKQICFSEDGEPEFKTCSDKQRDRRGEEGGGVLHSGVPRDDPVPVNRSVRSEHPGVGACLLQSQTFWTVQAPRTWWRSQPRPGDGTPEIHEMEPGKRGGSSG